MLEIKRVLCPVDFSDHSRRALDHAVAIARWYDAEVTVLHVAFAVPLALGPDAPAPVPTLTAAERQYIADHIARLVESARPEGVRIATAVRYGRNAAEEIQREADAIRADLVTLGTHGRSGFSRLLLGSVTEKVLRMVACPVLTVPRDATAPETPVAFKRILCPVDFSDSSAQAVEYALSLAQANDAHLTLLHVVTYDPATEAPELYDTVVANRVPSLDAYWEHMEASSREQLEAAIPPSAREFCTIDTMLAKGKPYREILRIARDEQADLIVMGVQGRGAVDLMFFGSTTQHVVRQAACPVLTIRKP